MSLTAAIALSVLTLGFAALGMRRRVWALAAFAALLPVYVIRLSLAVPGLPPVPSTWLEVLFAVLFLPWLFERGFRAEAWRGLNRWAYPLALLFAAATVAVLSSGDRLAGLGLFRAYFLEPVLLFAVFTDTIRTVRDRRLVLIGFAASLAAVAACAVFQKLTGYGIPNLLWQAAETRRVTAFYGFPNAIGLYLAPIVVLLGGWSASRLSALSGRFGWRAIWPFGRPAGSWAWPVLLALAAVLGTAACLFAVSKGALIGIFVGLAVFGLSDRRLRPLALVLVIFACLAVSLYRPLTDLSGRLLSGRDASSSVRVIIWGETAALFGDRPVFGGGLSGYPSAIAPYHEAKHIEVFQYPHNIALNFWTEIGLLGLIAFIWILALFFREAIREVRLGRSWLPLGLLSALAAILAHGLVDVPYFKNDLAFQFWILLGLLESRRLAADRPTPPAALPAEAE